MARVDKLGNCDVVRRHAHLQAAAAQADAADQDAWRLVGGNEEGGAARRSGDRCAQEGPWGASGTKAFEQVLAPASSKGRGQQVQRVARVDGGEAGQDATHASVGIGTRKLHHVRGELL